MVDEMIYYKDAYALIITKEQEIFTCFTTYILNSVLFHYGLTVTLFDENVLIFYIKVSQETLRD